MCKQIIVLTVALLSCATMTIKTEAQAVRGVAVKNHPRAKTADTQKIADTHLHFPMQSARQIEIMVQGDGRLWQTLTGIDMLYDLKTRDKHIIRLMLRLFRFTDQKKTRYDDASLEKMYLTDGIIVRVSDVGVADEKMAWADIHYTRHGKATEVLTEVEGGPGKDNTFRGSLIPGCGRRFETLMRRLAWRARHQSRVVVLGATPAS